MTETHRPEIKIGSRVRIVDRVSAYRGYAGRVSEIFDDVALVTVSTQQGTVFAGGLLIPTEVSLAVRIRDLIQTIT